jgi:hypothetical protein
MRKITLIIKFSLSLIFSIGMIGNTIVANIQSRVNEATTVELMATIKGVHTERVDNHLGVVIEAVEFSYLIKIYDIKYASVIADIENLEAGDKVFFRTEIKWASKVEELGVYDAVSLRDLTKVIYSLDDYNDYHDESRFYITILGVIISIVLLLLSSHYFRLLFGRRVH